MYKIAVIKGDGIGVDVVDESLRILDVISKKFSIDFQFIEYPWGSNFYLKHNQMAPDDFLETLGKFDSIFLGAKGINAEVL